MYKKILNRLENQLLPNKFHSELLKVITEPFSLTHNEENIFLNFKDITEVKIPIEDSEEFTTTYTKKREELEVVGQDEEGNDIIDKVVYQDDYTAEFEIVLTQIDEVVANHGIISDEELEVLKTDKLNSFKELCQNEIYAGFDMEIQGVTAHFGMNDHDQANMSQIFMFNMAGQVTFPTSWTTDSHGSFNLSQEEFMQMVGMATTHKESMFAKYMPLKDAVLNATSVEELDLIVWE